MKIKEFNSIDEVLDAIREEMENRMENNEHGTAAISDETKAEIHVHFDAIKKILDEVETQHGHQCAVVRALFAAFACSAFGIINGAQDGAIIRTIQLDMLGDAVHELIDAKAMTHYEYRTAAESQDSVVFFNAMREWARRKAEGITVEESEEVPVVKQAHYSEVTRTMDNILPMTGKQNIVH